GDGGELAPRLRAFGRIVADIRPPEAAPFAPADRGVARGADIAVADLAAFDLVGLEQARAPPAGKRRGELPRQVDGVADAEIHAEPAGRDDQMHRVAGKEDAVLAIAVGE